MDNLRKFSAQTGITDSSDHGQKNSAPRRIGNYLLQRELGRGFSSVVYEAAEAGRQRTVALKALTFLQSLSEDRRADLSQRFQREATAVSALTHPNIVSLYDVGQTQDGQQFIAMELLQGESLRQRLQRPAPLPIPQAVAIAVRIAEALHYAHGRGVIHRDVKPDNIFLAHEPLGTEVTPKLMDFGIAHVLSDQGLTQDGTIVGSPAYMSPEQINGETLDARTDVFSLAVTLAEMVAGHKPFEAETIPAVMQQILRHAPRLRTISHKPLRRVLTKALAKNPHGRYADAEAFARALRHAVPLTTLSASVATHILDTTASGIKPARITQRPSPIAIGFGVLAFATLALLPLFTPRPAHPANQPQPTTQGAMHPIPNTSALHRRIAAGWHRAAPQRNRITLVAQTIPKRRILSYYPYLEPLSQQSRPQLTAPKTASPVAPVAPVPPAVPTQPTLTAAMPPRPSRLTGMPVKPIIRIAASQQELRPAAKTVPSVVPAIVPDAEPATETEEDAPPRASGLADSVPHAVQRSMPTLPPDVPPDLSSAIIRVRVTIDEDGQVSDAQILASSGSAALDQAALDCVRQWEYDPAIRGGQSVSATVTEQVKFVSR